MKRLLLLLVSAGLVAAACGVPLTGNGAGSDFRQTRQRALDALSQPNQIFHAVESVSRDGVYQRNDEVWLDPENDVARQQEGGQLRIFHDGKIAELDNQKRLEDGEIWPSDVDNTSALSLSHINLMFSNEVRNSDVQVLQEQGAAAYRVDVETEWHGDWTGSDQVQIYLDKDYLPARIVDKVEGAGPEDREIDTDVTYDFIPRSNLPADFMSLDAINALTVMPVGFLQEAVAKGIQPYWLGETFEGMSLTDVRLGQPVVELTYAEQGNEEPGWGPPGFVVQVSTATPDFCPALLGAGTVRQEVVVQGRTAMLCQADGANIGLAGDQYLELLISFDGMNVVVKPSYGAPGTNPYRKIEDMLRLGAALRPFEGPSQ